MPAEREPGFRSLRTERQCVDLPVEGSIPAWLGGSLLRNGPAEFEPADQPVDHWFDGLAMLHRFAIDDGRVRYTNRFLRSDAYERAMQGGGVSGFATGSAGLLGRVKAFLLEETYDNANVIAERIGDQYLALTETPRPVVFDPETLETRGHAPYDGPAPGGHLACAHVQHDPWTGGVVTFETEFGRTSTYHVYETDDPATREPIASIAVDEPAYMHSFALTRQYVVLTEFPYVVNPLDFLTGGSGSFIDAFRWEPERGTRFVVIDRASGTVVAEPRTEAFFGFHHVNAYEHEDEVVLDLETVPAAPESIGALYLDDLRENQLDVPAGTLERFRVHPEEATVDRTEYYAGGTALPRVSPAVRCRKHRYVYAQSVEQPATSWPRTIVKVDVGSGATQEFDGDGTYLSEPVFVPRPDGDTEDDGVVLAVGLDPESGHSWLLVLDGETLTERARAAVPHAIPFDFHGRYFQNL